MAPGFPVRMATCAITTVTTTTTTAFWMPSDTGSRLDAGTGRTASNDAARRGLGRGGATRRPFSRTGQGWRAPRYIRPPPSRPPRNRPVAAAPEAESLLEAAHLPPFIPPLEPAEPIAPPAARIGQAAESAAGGSKSSDTAGEAHQDSSGTSNGQGLNGLSQAVGSLWNRGSGPLPGSAEAVAAHRVMMFAWVVVIFYSLHFTRELWRYHTSSVDPPGSRIIIIEDAALLSLQLLIPGCGFCGAMRRSRQLVCYFCSCSLFTTMAMFVSLVNLVIRVTSLNGQCGMAGHELRVLEACRVWAQGGFGRFLMLVVDCGDILVGCMAFWFGRTLYRYQRLAQTDAKRPSLDDVDLASHEPLPEAEFPKTAEENSTRSEGCDAKGSDNVAGSQTSGGVNLGYQGPGVLAEGYTTRSPLHASSRGGSWSTTAPGEP